MAEARLPTVTLSFGSVLTPIMPSGVATCATVDQTIHGKATEQAGDENAHDVPPECGQADPSAGGGGAREHCALRNVLAAAAMP